MKPSELDLIENVSVAISDEFSKMFGTEKPVAIFCGKGNNGGDGLAIARLLSEKDYNVEVILLHNEKELSPSNKVNFERLPSTIKVSDLNVFKQANHSNSIYIDAIIGAGLRGPLEGVEALCVDIINNSKQTVVSIDIPSGLGSQFNKLGDKVVKANLTICAAAPKLSLVLPENFKYVGDLITVKSKYSSYLIEEYDLPFTFVDEEYACNLVPTRDRFSHKGNYGHTLIIAGGEGMLGAAILAVGGALRSGCGLVTAYLPRLHTSAMYAVHPSAMIMNDSTEHFTKVPENLERFSSIGIGCGLGKRPDTHNALLSLIEECKVPMVIDADALNIIAGKPELLKSIHRGSVITPHPKELARLIGEWKDENDKFEKSKKLSLETGLFIVVKGANSQIFTPTGEVFINSTGTPGMAKGGSGDVLTGIISGLLASGWSSLNASLFGVYIHGKAGQAAAEAKGINSMSSNDIIDYIKF